MASEADVYTGTFTMEQKFSYTIKTRITLSMSSKSKGRWLPWWLPVPSWVMTFLTSLISFSQHRRFVCQFLSQDTNDPKVTYKKKQKTLPIHLWYLGSQINLLPNWLTVYQPVIRNAIKLIAPKMSSYLIWIRDHTWRKTVTRYIVLRAFTYSSKYTFL